MMEEDNIGKEGPGHFTEHVVDLYAGLPPYLVDPITLFSPKTEQEPDAEP